jgi:hypothetical protein
VAMDATGKFHRAAHLALIAGLAEIGSLSAKQAAMIVGLAPIAWDSGQSSGARHKGGRAHVRRALYMAAVRRALQSGAQGLPTTASSPTAKSPKSPSSPYAKARHPRKHPRRRKPDLRATSCLTPVTYAPLSHVSESGQDRKRSQTTTTDSARAPALGHRVRIDLSPMTIDAFRLA